MVSHSSGLYGSERSLIELCSALRQKGWDLQMILPSAGPLRDLLVEAQIAHFIHPFKGWLAYKVSPLRTLFHSAVNFMASWSMARRVTEKHFELVYSNTLASPFGAMLAQRLNLPHIWHARELVEENTGARFEPTRAQALQFVNAVSCRVICNSKAVAQELKEHIPAEKLVVIYNGFPDLENPNKSESHKPKAGSPLSLCMVGSLHPSKGHADAIQALAFLSRQGIQARLQIAGNGRPTYIHQILRLANQLGVADYIKILGYQRDPKPLFRDADIVLICTRSEAFGRVAVEALSMGCPVIGTRSGGLPEIIEPGVTGLLYSPGHPAELAEQIINMKNNVNLYEQISSNARRILREKFSLSSSVEATHLLLQKVLERS